MTTSEPPRRLALAAGLGALLGVDAGPVLALAAQTTAAAPKQAAAQPAAPKAEKRRRASRQGRAGHRRARQRRAGHRLRDPAARQVPRAQYQHRRAGARRTPSAWRRPRAPTSQLRAILEEMIQKNRASRASRSAPSSRSARSSSPCSLQKQAIDGARAALLPQFRKEAQEELIEERLKLQEAKRLGIEISDDEVKRIMKGLAERNKMTEEQFAPAPQGHRRRRLRPCASASGRSSPGARWCGGAFAALSPSPSATSTA